jgi:DNA polymerase-4/DNA polymerase V
MLGVAPVHQSFKERGYHGSYELIAHKMKDAIERDLGITVSVGLSLTKSLAKLCSKFRKPSGFTAVPGRYIHILLGRTPLEKVWGFGPNTVAYLTKLGLRTALDFVSKSGEWAEEKLGKIGIELWKELRGDSVYLLDGKAKNSYRSIGKSKTFAPPSDDPDYVLAQLLRNLESACIKARRYELVASRLVIYLRGQDFSHRGCEAELSRPTIATLELIPIARELFKSLYETNKLYRATGVVLSDLRKSHEIQFGLFEDPVRVLKIEKASEAIDDINEHYGKHTIHVGEGLLLKGRPRGKNESVPTRKQDLLPGETQRQRLRIPMLDIKAS